MYVCIHMYLHCLWIENSNRTWILEQHACSHERVGHCVQFSSVALRWVPKFQNRTQNSEIERHTYIYPFTYVFDFLILQIYKSNAQAMAYRWLLSVANDNTLMTTRMEILKKKMHWPTGWACREFAGSHCITYMYVCMFGNNRTHQKRRVHFSNKKNGAEGKGKEGRFMDKWTDWLIDSVVSQSMY